MLHNKWNELRTNLAHGGINKGNLSQTTAQEWVALRSTTEGIAGAGKAALSAVAIFRLALFVWLELFRNLISVSTLVPFWEKCKKSKPVSYIVYDFLVQAKMTTSQCLFQSQKMRKSYGKWSGYIVGVPKMPTATSSDSLTEVFMSILYANHVLRPLLSFADTFREIQLLQPNNGEHFALYIYLSCIV